MGPCEEAEAVLAGWRGQGMEPGEAAEAGHAAVRGPSGVWATGATGEGAWTMPPPRWLGPPVLSSWMWGPDAGGCDWWVEEGVFAVGGWVWSAGPAGSSSRKSRPPPKPKGSSSGSSIAWRCASAQSSSGSCGTAGPGDGGAGSARRGFGSILPSSASVNPARRCGKGRVRWRLS